MTSSKFNEAYLQIIKEDYDTEMNNVPAETETEADEKPLKRVTFLTSDEVLIDALNSGVEEVVLFTNAKDETTGEDTVVEVKFGKDSFGELEIIDNEETDVTEEDEMTAEDTEIEEDAEGGDEGSVEGEDAEIEEDTEDSVEGEDTEIEEDIAVECDEWLEDGVCVKCQSSDCDGSCKCEKCGDVNCIGDCQ